MTELHTFFINCLTSLSKESAAGSKALQEQFDALASDWLTRDGQRERSLRSIEQRLRALESRGEGVDE
jgi:hypothetical protein